MKKVTTKNLVFSGVCLALCFLLPFLSGQIPAVGNKLCLMHIPVLLCGFLCGWQYGAVVGFFAPLLRYILFGAPPVIPNGICMAFELAAYGFFAGLLYKTLKKTTANLYLSLFISMLLGRFVWGICAFFIYPLIHMDFTFSVFVAAAFTNALPGIVCHILLIPAIVLGLKNSETKGRTHG